jgi:hypothetical protein
MQKKKLIAIALLTLIVISSAIYFVQRQKHPNAKKSAQPTVEEIMAERALKAGKQLETPLGKALADRNWPEVEKLYHPDQQFVQLGEIIRALFIEGKMKAYQAIDQERLMSMVLSTFESMPEKNLHLAGMLVNQLERLPSPKHDSPNFKILKKWASDPKEFALKRKLGVFKLVLNDADPDPAATELLKSAIIDGDTLGQSRAEWIQRVDEIRSYPVQMNVVEYLGKRFKKIPTDAQPTALVVLSHHLNFEPEEVKKLTLQFFDSGNLSSFEAALKSLPYLIRANLLKNKEKTAIVTKLTNLPPPVKTPFVEAKSAEILGSLKSI